MEYVKCNTDNCITDVPSHLLPRFQCIAYLDNTRYLIYLGNNSLARRLWIHEQLCQKYPRQLIIRGNCYILKQPPMFSVYNFICCNMCFFVLQSIDVTFICYMINIDPYIHTLDLIKAIYFHIV